MENFFENYFESNLSSLHLHQIKAFLRDTSLFLAAL